MGSKKLRKVQKEGRCAAAFARSALIEPLLALWLGQSDPLIREYAVRVLCVLPLYPRVANQPVSASLLQDFISRFDIWPELSQDEKVACLVLALHIETPWDTERLLSFSNDLLNDLGPYRITKLRQLVAAFGGDPEPKRSRAHLRGDASTPHGRTDSERDMVQS
jgi:hypothetical protein